MIMLRYNFMHASHVRFQMYFLPEELVTKRATKFGWYIIAAHCVALQMVFKFECACAILANELWLYSALVLQMAG